MATLQYFVFRRVKETKKEPEEPDLSPSVTPPAVLQATAMASGGVMVAPQGHGNNHFEPMDTSLILEKLGERAKKLLIHV